MTKVVLLPSPYMMLMRLRWTRIMDEFFLKDNLSIFYLKLNLKITQILKEG
jgi:hypothetical protein